MAEMAATAQETPRELLAQLRGWSPGNGREVRSALLAELRLRISKVLPSTAPGMTVAEVRDALGLRAGPFDDHTGLQLKESLVLGPFQATRVGGCPTRYWMQPSAPEPDARDAGPPVRLRAARPAPVRVPADEASAAAAAAAAARQAETCAALGAAAAARWPEVPLMLRLVSGHPQPSARGTTMDAAKLTDLDGQILTPLLEGPRELTREGEKHMEDLIGRGYVRVSAARCGPLGLFTGDKMAALTEAGRRVLAGASATTTLLLVFALAGSARATEPQENTEYARPALVVPAPQKWVVKGPLEPQEETREKAPPPPEERPPLLIQATVPGRWLCLAPPVGNPGPAMFFVTDRIGSMGELPPPPPPPPPPPTRAILPSPRDYARIALTAAWQRLREALP